MSILGHSSEEFEVPVYRKPRIAIMGEFSVGKSTLSNLLIGSNPLPVKVTATQLPPVWMAYGDQEPYREDLEGNKLPVDLDRLDEVPLETTSVIRIFLKSEMLELCDLIDMPGISDPNMSADVWQRVIHHADSVLWCTHATQAWRQSEAAVWKTMPADLFAKSLLLITRVDKLLTDRDRQKVVKRVGRETSDLFAGQFPISLTEALEAQNDRDLWKSCGAELFIQTLVDLSLTLTRALEDDDANIISSSANPEHENPIRKVHKLGVSHKEDLPRVARVTPKRVRPSTRSTNRPTKRPGRLTGPVLAADSTVDQAFENPHESLPRLRIQNTQEVFRPS